MSRGAVAMAGRRMKAFRLRNRTFLLAVAALTLLLAWVVVPAWDYYGLPPSTRSILSRLGAPLRLASPGPATLADLLKSIRVSSPDGKGVGIPIYVDPTGLGDAGANLSSPIPIPPAGVSTRAALEDSLRPLGMGYYVEDGLLRITTDEAADRALRERPKSARRP
jgi:hypothetical protein